MVKKEFISKDDLKLFMVANSVDQAVNEVTNFYRVYHSIRYVGPLTIVRLNKPLLDEEIKELNREFSDILVEGKIESSPPRPEEVEDKDHLKLPRLSMRFNRKDFGRLYEMIRRINGF